MKFIVTLAVFLLSCLSYNAWGYETNVHRQITINAMAASNTELYLSNLTLSLDSEFNSKRARTWIEDGSESEDNSPRWTNHFYDPTTGKGLNVNVYDPVFGTVLFTVSGESSLPWAKDSTNNVNSWKWARDAYYKALIDADSKLREGYFAMMFTDLGQVLHLVQDLSVPSHVRNDCHLTLDWLPAIGSIVGPTVEMAVQQKDMYEKYTKDAPLKYDGYPPVDTTTAFTILDSFWKNDGKGLAEFTNRNFVSRNTNFDDPDYQNYKMPIATGKWVTKEQVPNYATSGLTTEEVDVTYSKGNVTDYYKGGTSKTIDRLSAYSYFDYEMKLRNLGREVYSLNNKVHKEYADFLIPRAVGYSAGLLNYFFRGQMEADGVETVDSSGVSGIDVTIKNTTPNEDMSSGTFFISYRYKFAGSTEFTYGLSDGVNSGTLPFNTEVPEYSFTFSQPIPNDATEKQYILVFHGTLGNEQGAVVGKVITLGAWEDWEKGLTGRHSWSQAYGNLDSFTVVDGFAENSSKVLKITTSYGFLGTPPQISIAPKKVSFDYYVQSFSHDNRDNIDLTLLGYSPYNHDTNIRAACWIGLYNPTAWGYCGTDICKSIERGKWVHLEVDISQPCSWLQRVDGVEIEIWGTNASYSELLQTELYIDNINFDY